MGLVIAIIALLIMFMLVSFYVVIKVAALLLRVAFIPLTLRRR